MGPTPLVRPLIHVVGSVEVADQHPLELVPQHLLHHRPAPAGPVEEVAHLWRAETPEIPITAIFPPARFVPVHHGTGSDLLAQPAVLLPAMLRRPPNQAHQFSQAQAQAKTPLQVALYHPEGEPALLPQHAYFALHRNAEPLPPHRYGAPVRVRGPPLPAPWAGPLQHHMLGYPCPYPRQGDHLAATAHSPAAQSNLAIGATGRGVFHPVGGLLPSPAKAVGPLPPFSLGAGGPVGLDPRRRLPLLHSIGWRLLLAFQLGDPGFQNLDMTKEPTN